MQNKFLALFLLIFVFNCSTTCSQAKTNQDKNYCFQEKEKKLEIIKIAEENQYKIRHIFTVNKKVSFKNPLRKYLNEEFNEKYEVSLDNLLSSIEEINKLDVIEPITLELIEVRLETDKDRGSVIDLSICIEQNK